jgi:hypothetical protein
MVRFSWLPPNRECVCCSQGCRFGQPGVLQGFRTGTSSLRTPLRYGCAASYAYVWDGWIDRFDNSVDAPCFRRCFRSTSLWDDFNYLCQRVSKLTVDRSAASNSTERSSNLLMRPRVCICITCGPARFVSKSSRSSRSPCDLAPDQGFGDSPRYARHSRSRSVGGAPRFRNFSRRSAFLVIRF